jgi:uncharacterized protein (TIRG00374 family)
MGEPGDIGRRPAPPAGSLPLPHDSGSQVSGSALPTVRSRRLPLAPLAVSAACLIVLAVRLDWSRVLPLLATAQIPLLSLGAALTLLNLVLRAARWRLLLGRSAPAVTSLLSTYAVGVAAGLIVPGSGELARALLLGRRVGLRTSYLLGAAAVEKLLDTAAVVALSLVGLWVGAGLVSGTPAAGRGAALVVVGVLALLVVAASVPARGLTAPRWVPRALARPLDSLSLALAEAWGRFADGARAVARLPRRVQLAIIALTLVGWGNACLITVCALLAFDLPGSWALAAVLYGALLLGLSVPSAPAAVGTFELVTVAVLDAYGLPAASSAAFALGFHLVTFAPPIVAGALAWWLARPGAAPLDASRQGS